MYLVNARKLITDKVFQLEHFPDERSVEYAILSHRWEDERIQFKKVFPTCSYSTVKRLKGFEKVWLCCWQAVQDGLSYAWVDTCCIDKSSSAELQEAINSMYRWYSSAVVCYAYLADVWLVSENLNSFRSSLWFTRGWTLQELIAPKSVRFYGQFWDYIGDRVKLAHTIAEVTSVNITILKDGLSRDKMPMISEIMSWARHRKTTRVEDRAYSLMGLFDVNMPLLYGEGEKAFKRLQEEIIRNTEDQSIFAWEHDEPGYPGYLARSPDDFNIDPYSYTVKRGTLDRIGPHTITNQSISMYVQLIPWAGEVYLAKLNCSYTRSSGPASRAEKVAYGIFLRRVNSQGDWGRIRQDGHMTHLIINEHFQWVGYPDVSYTPVNIVKTMHYSEVWDWDHKLQPLRGFKFKVVAKPEDDDDYGFNDDCRYIEVPIKTSFRSIFDAKEEAYVTLPGDNGFLALADLSKCCPQLTKPVHLIVGFYDDWVPHCFVDPDGSLFQIWPWSESAEYTVHRELATQRAKWRSCSETLKRDDLPIQIVAGKKHTEFLYVRLLKTRLLAFRAGAKHRQRKEPGDKLLDFQIRVRQEDNVAMLRIKVFHPLLEMTTFLPYERAWAVKIIPAEEVKSVSREMVVLSKGGEPR